MTEDFYRHIRYLYHQLKDKIEFIWAVTNIINVQVNKNNHGPHTDPCGTTECTSSPFRTLLPGY